MRGPRHVTATELAECCVCEQRVVFDQTRGKRRTMHSERQMRAGTATHAELHRKALRQLEGQPDDARCFVATALWGPVDPRTEVLRAWRDRWLLKRWWGPAIVRSYYAASPCLVALVTRAPLFRKVLEAA